MNHIEFVVPLRDDALVRRARVKIHGIARAGLAELLPRLIGEDPRQLARLNYRPKEDIPVGLAFWDELFLGMAAADWAAKGFDQNRAHLGLAIYSKNELFRTEIGYLNVYLNRQINRMSHVLALTFFVSHTGKKPPKWRW